MSAQKRSHARETLLRARSARRVKRRDARRIVAVSPSSTPQGTEVSALTGPPLELRSVIGRRPWTNEERAESLADRRGDLLARLPRELAAAQSLDPDTREWVLDEAILFTAFEHGKPVSTQADLDAVLWSACSVRVKRARSGRFNLVRGQHFTQVDAAALDDVPADEDPEAAALACVELETLLEFARLLTPIERAVIYARHDHPAADKVHGYATIATMLDLPEKEVRSALRTVSRKLDTFAIVVADRDSFERKLAELLPIPVVAVEARQRTGLREAIVDWLSRPFGHDLTMHVATAGGGGGRGIGTLLVTVCIGGSVAGGSYCAITGDLPLQHPEAPTSARRAKVEPPVAETPGIQARVKVSTLTALAEQDRAEVERRAARRRRAKRQTAARKREARSERVLAAAQRRQETAAAKSPAAPNAATDGSSEFDPTFQPTQPSQPAQAADSGLPEFP